MADILVNGTLKNNTESGVIAYAEQIRVSASKKQSQVNSEFDSRITVLENSGSGSGSGGESADITDLENRVATLESGVGLSDSNKNYEEGAHYGPRENGEVTIVLDLDYALSKEFIPVTEGATYTFNLGKAEDMGKVSARIILYDSSKEYLSYYMANKNSRTLTLTTSGVSFVRMSFPLGHLDEVSVVDSSDNVIWQPQKRALSITELLNKDRLALRNVYSASSDLRLLFFSDIHGDNIAFQRIVEMANGWKLGDHVDAVLNGGDTTEDYTTTTGVDWYNALVPTLKVPLLMVLGNHDTRMDLEDWDAYDRVMKVSMVKLSSLVGENLVQPTDSTPRTKSYYYVDFDSHIDGSTNKIRVIALDCMSANSYWKGGSSTGDDGDGVERTWLADTLADANTKGYYVIILNHSAPSGNNNTLISSNFTESDYDANDTWRMVLSAVTEVNTFITNGGKFICWLCGHKHKDFLLNPVIGSTTLTNQPMFVTRCATSKRGWAAPYRTYDKYDVFRDSFNYITIDLANSILRIIRIGKNYDSRLVSKTGMEYNFSTHQVTKQW